MLHRGGFGLNGTIPWRICECDSHRVAFANMRARTSLTPPRAQFRTATAWTRLLRTSTAQTRLLRTATAWTRHICTATTQTSSVSCMHASPPCPNLTHACPSSSIIYPSPSHLPFYSPLRGILADAPPPTQRSLYPLRTYTRSSDRLTYPI